MRCKASCRARVLIALAISTSIHGCHRSSSTSVTVTVLPLSSSVAQGGTQIFVARVMGSSNTAVNWNVQEGATGGSITSAGQYTAPNAAGFFHVIATSQADSTKSATATVAVQAVSVFVQPASITMTTDETTTFRGIVTGTVNSAVAWSLQESSGGQVSSAGSYTSPAGFGLFHVVATSQADTSKSAIAAVTVGPVSVSVFPASDVLGPGGVRQFSATVTAIEKRVMWSVREGAAGGTVSSSGLYTSPNPAGSFHVVATSVRDPSKDATAAVTVVAAGFRPTGSMTTGRSAHSATVLQGGKVLIAGGDASLFNSYFYCYFYSCSAPLKSAEIYDPASDTFSGAAGLMSTTRVSHTATLLSSGNVLLAGGPGASADLYDPTAGTFTPTGSMSVPRTSHTATPLNTGKVLVVGGFNLTGILRSAELYDPATGTFALTGSLNAARTSHTATLLPDGRVLIAGGSQSGPSPPTAELYDPVNGTFSTTGNLGTPRVSHTATLLDNGKVLIAGGFTTGGLSASAELYDPISGLFTATGTMVTKRQAHIAVKLSNGNVLLAGGSQGEYTAELYNPASGTFTQTGSMAAGRSIAVAALLPLPDGRVLVVGGSDLASADIYK